MLTASRRIFMKIRVVKYIGVVLGLAFSIASPAFAQEGDLPSDDLPCVYPRMDQMDLHLRAMVTQSGRAFKFDYFVENRSGTTFQPLEQIAVQAFPGVGTDFAQASQAHWDAEGAFTDSEFYSWINLESPQGLYPGQSSGGLGFAQADLPVIARFMAWNYVSEPPSFPEGMAPESCEGTDLFENSFKGKTVGPKPPPQTFVPLEFLNYLIALLHDSRQQVWITRDRVHQSLLAKLINAKRKLEAGQSHVAKNMLKAFLHEVRATSCPEFTCPGNKPLTSEAYALLYFNGRYLLEHLPKPTDD